MSRYRSLLPLVGYKCVVQRSNTDSHSPAIVEVGGVTETKQSGNSKPRVFRIPSQQGMINRYGLNSDGAALVAARLRKRVRDFAYSQGYGLDEDAEKFVLNGGAGVPPGSLVKGKLLSVQVAKNHSTSDEDLEAITRDYTKATSLLAKYADIIVVNVSCPNAPGYRELQQVEPLTKILTNVVGAAASVDRNVKTKVMVKVSPDEDSEEQVASICAAVWKSGVDGVVVGNTTTSRPKGPYLSSTEAAVMEERGGYSGPQLFHRTVSLVKKYRQILDYPLYEQHESEESQPQPQPQPQEATSTRIEASVKRDEQNLKGATDESAKQPLIRVPERHSLSTTGDTGSDTATSLSATLTPKVIFCTGGITNGQQALEVLNAGASVAQIYTGTIFLKFKTLCADAQYDSSCLRRCWQSDL